MQSIRYHHSPCESSSAKDNHQALLVVAPGILPLRAVVGRTAGVICDDILSILRLAAKDCLPICTMVGDKVAPQLKLQETDGNNIRSESEILQTMITNQLSAI